MVKTRAVLLKNFIGAFLNNLLYGLELQAKRSYNNPMKKLLVSVLIVLVMSMGFAGLAEARSTRVRGYTNSRGTYVAPHYRSAPNRTRFDNYSTKGNHNPYTGKKGYASPYKSYRW